MSFNSKIFLLLMILGLLIIAKIFYTYHNFFIEVVFIILSITYTFKVRNNLNFTRIKKFILVISLVITTIVILIPDRIIFHQLNPELLKWKKLKWSDFKGEPDENSTYQAVTTSGFSIRFNKVYNYPPAMLTSVFYNKKSWKIHPEFDSDNILKHEQGHFDLTEIYARIARDSINKSWYKSDNEILEMVRKIHEERIKKQSLYDSVTSHGMDSINQINWNIMIKN